MLEGDQAVVRGLYDRIRMDVRHQHVTNVWTSNAVERRFPSWTMGFEDLGPHARSLSADGRLEGGDEREAFSPASVDASAGSPEQQDYLERRRAALRRALVSGDRLVGALGIILNGHEPEAVEGADQTSSVRCRTCRSQDAPVPVLEAYPCPTAKNALWALEAATHR